MMFGCSDCGAFWNRGIFRLAHLGSLVFYSTKNAKNGLELDEAFAHLDMSEKTPTSYHIGMGIAKAFSEDHLNIPWLSHISSFKSSISWNGPAASGKISLYALPTGKRAKEPDLLGYDRNGNPHVLESKGYSSGFKSAALQHAINQVSQVSSISGVTPETRVAIFSDLSKRPFHAKVVDPDGPESWGCTIDWPLSSCIRDYYSVFLGDKEKRTEFQVNNQRYIGFHLIRSGLQIGLDARIFDCLAQSGNQLGRAMLDIQAELQEISKDSENYNIGIDGVALIDQG